MQINCDVEYYEYKNRIRNLTVEAQGVVKSQKFFPVYLKKGKEEIFKPISKTKPLATPFFAYSEVFWSTVINKYFDSTAPIYRLAICNGYSDEVPKYHNHGVIVPSILKEGEQLVNILEYFKKYPDEAFDREKYINYCMKIYDYAPVFNTKIIRENDELGKQLALQVLISILKADQNYHYENVAFICKEGHPIAFAPPIDHEFSSMFLYIDYIELNKSILATFAENLIMKELENPKEKMLYLLSQQIPGVSTNLDIIVERYEDVVQQFLKSLQLFIYDLEHSSINLKNNNYLYPFNSNNYKAGIVAYKNNNLELGRKMLSDLKQYLVDISEISKIIQNEVLNIAKLLEKNLIHRLEVKHQKKISLSKTIY